VSLRCRKNILLQVYTGIGQANLPAWGFANAYLDEDLMQQVGQERSGHGAGPGRISDSTLRSNRVQVRKDRTNLQLADLLLCSQKSPHLIVNNQSGLFSIQDHYCRYWICAVRQENVPATPLVRQQLALQLATSERENLFSFQPRLWFLIFFPASL
jgi:hypothetical protein